MLKRNEQIDTIENHHSKRSHCIHFNKLYRIFFFVCLLNNSLFLCVRIGICVYVCVIMRLCPFHGNFFGMIYLKPNNNNPIWIKKKTIHKCESDWVNIRVGVHLLYLLLLLLCHTDLTFYRYGISSVVARTIERDLCDSHTHTHTHTLQCDLFILFVTSL